MRKIEVYELEYSNEIVSVPPVLVAGETILILDKQSGTAYEKDIYGNIAESVYLLQFIKAEPVEDSITFQAGTDTHTFPNTHEGIWDAIKHLYHHKANDEYRIENIENVFNPLMLPEDQKTRFNPDVIKQTDELDQY